MNMTTFACALALALPFSASAQDAAKQGTQKEPFARAVDDQPKSGRDYRGVVVLAVALGVVVYVDYQRRYALVPYVNQRSAGIAFRTEW